MSLTASNLKDRSIIEATLLVRTEVKDYYVAVTMLHPISTVEYGLSAPCEAFLIPSSLQYRRVTNGVGQTANNFYGMASVQCVGSSEHVVNDIVNKNKNKSEQPSPLYTKVSVQAAASNDSKIKANSIVPRLELFFSEFASVINPGVFSNRIEKEAESISTSIDFGVAHDSTNSNTVNRVIDSFCPR
ncbi:hypothetical protein PoB_001116200 [Plakobranchus ocellatus]|uniref:Uncharacterized protein n=1 Tax=Plakobranchus ocellatus TaxID=259542 RepID=A0AAV3YQB4_9GAST|nr:hypothetical protein PoB_001116200 [Plakobranchus ocellatus]